MLTTVTVFSAILQSKVAKIDYGHLSKVLGMNLSFDDFMIDSHKFHTSICHAPASYRKDASVFTITITSNQHSYSLVKSAKFS